MQYVSWLSLPNGISPQGVGPNPDRPHKPGHLLNLQPQMFTQSHVAAQLQPGLDNWVNLKAPGIREQLPDAVMPFQSLEQRGALYDPLRPGSAPIAFGDYRPGFLSDQRSLNFQEEMRYILNETPVLEHWSNRDVGQFTVPYTGFSRLRDIKPCGTAHFI